MITQSWQTQILVAGVAAMIACAGGPAWASRNAQGIGNAIFIHPDGAGLNHWGAARMFWAGPDDTLAWDKLPAMAV